MNPMTAREQLAFDRADRLNDAAGEAILDGDFVHAASLLEQAALWSPSEEGKRALRARAVEALEMGRPLDGPVTRSA